MFKFFLFKAKINWFKPIGMKKSLLLKDIFLSLKNKRTPGTEHFLICLKLIFVDIC
jgi:hypothetical protein